MKKEGGKKGGRVEERRKEGGKEGEGGGGGDSASINKMGKNQGRPPNISLKAPTTTGPHTLAHLCSHALNYTSTVTP